ncbi:MAG: helix-turn-helix domain-containing protein [Oscillospiraceae bacterium]|nr:helix-turn-helix domain-containing protein [Oscillospiraceae bacterium]
MQIDEILKTIRKELCISQETLARDLNVSFATLNRWENNRAKPSRLAMLQLKEYAAQSEISSEVVVALEHIRV